MASSSLSALAIIGCVMVVLIICLPDADAKSCRSSCRKCVTRSCRHVCRPRPRWRLYKEKCSPINTCNVTRRCAEKGSCSVLHRWRLHRHKCSSLFTCGSACRKCVINRCRLPCTSLVKHLRSEERICSLVCDPNCVGGCSVSGNGSCDGKCKPGYALTPDHTCAQCDPYCAGGCDVQGPNKCDQTCTNNYFLDTSVNLCGECDPYCYPTLPGNCSQLGQCDAVCIAGYVVNVNTKRCAVCGDHCDRCTVPGQCEPDGCQFGYAFDGNSKACEACSEYCAVGCTQPGLCSGNCILGYGRSNPAVESTCNVCDVDCDPTTGCNANGAGYCDTRCKVGFALSDINYCEPCQAAPACPANTDCSATGPFTCNKTACENNGGTYDPQFFTCG